MAAPLCRGFSSPVCPVARPRLSLLHCGDLDVGDQGLGLLAGGHITADQHRGLKYAQDSMLIPISPTDTPLIVSSSTAKEPVWLICPPSALDLACCPTIRAASKLSSQPNG